MNSVQLPAIITKLDRRRSLNEADRAALLALPFRYRDESAGALIVREGDEVRDCCFLLKGVACRSKIARTGARQIVSFHLPGDILDVQHLLLPRADHNVQMITAAKLAFVPAAELKRVMQERPAIGEELWRSALIDASIFREWVLNVGRRDAKSRIAHMLCEFSARGQAIGLGSPDQFELPMTQEQIGDATGLTAVHVNRMLRELDEEGVIARDQRRIRVLDWQKMKRVADFDAAYLHAAA